MLLPHLPCDTLLLLLLLSSTHRKTTCPSATPQQLPLPHHREQTSECTDWKLGHCCL